ncbi:MAG TPA: MBL fold metallo-hydrolase [Chloroflexota bacterium]|nr:MBL fold metallo-hydrolase [Chloroflexota bacterium]
MAQYPRIDVVLGGYDLGTDVGLAAFCSVVLIEAPDASGALRRILVDPAHVGRRRFLLDALARRGLTPTDIDLVVLTHAHWDHIQNLDVFDHAPIYLHPDERKYAQRPHRNDWATPQWTGAIIERQDAREIAEGGELLPGIGVVDMPGHSPGSIGISVPTEAGLAVITGDALHFAYVLRTGINPLVFWDAEQAKRSIERIAALADVIYPGHDRPFRVAKSGEIEYLVPFRLTVNGIQPGMEGLEFPPPTQRVPWVMPGVEEQLARLRGTTPATTPT